MTPGTFTIGTDNPAYPPYFAEPADGYDRDRSRGRSATRPTARASRAPSATRSPRSSASPRTRSPGSSSRSRTRLRRVRRPSTSTSTRSPGSRTDADRRPVQGLLLRQPVARRPQGQPAGQGHDRDRAQGRPVRRPGRHDQPDAITSVIAPTKKPLIYDTNDLAIKALGNKTIDGVVVDLPTADFITNVQVENAAIAGQFEGGTPEYFSAVLTKGSPLTACVNAAIDALTADGTLDDLVAAWLPFQGQVPVFKP